MVDTSSWGVAVAARAGGLAVLLGFAGCSLDAGDPEPQLTSAPDTAAINAAYGAPDSRQLELAVNSCNRDPQAEVEESGSDIRVTVSLAGVDSGLDCQDSVKVELASPLDGRRVIDAVNGQPVPVQPAE